MTLALGAPGRSDRLVLRAAPGYFDGIAERFAAAWAAPACWRPACAGPIRAGPTGSASRVAGADGRALLGPLPAADDRARTRPRPAASRDLASPGWLVTAAAPGIPLAGPAGPDPRLIALGLALVLGAGGLGYALGGRVSARAAPGRRRGPGRHLWARRRPRGCARSRRSRAASATAP